MYHKIIKIKIINFVYSRYKVYVRLYSSLNIKRPEWYDI